MMATLAPAVSRAASSSAVRQVVRAGHNPGEGKGGQQAELLDVRCDDVTPIHRQCASFNFDITPHMFPKIGVCLPPSPNLYADVLSSFFTGARERRG